MVAQKLLSHLSCFNLSMTLEKLSIAGSPTSTSEFPNKRAVRQKKSQVKIISPLAVSYRSLSFHYSTSHDFIWGYFIFITTNLLHYGVFIRQVKFTFPVRRLINWFLGLCINKIVFN